MKSEKKSIFDIVLSKGFCLAYLIAAYIYGIILPFCWGNDPWSSTGTLSVLCEHHKPFFWLWVLLIGGAFLLNINYAYKKYGENSKFLKVLTWLSFIACCCIALTLEHDITKWEPKRIVHWIATGLYMGGLGLSMFIFYLKNHKRYKGFITLAVCTVLLVLLIVVWLFTLGKSSMMELLPSSMLQIMLFIVNFTPVIKAKSTDAEL